MGSHRADHRGPIRRPSKASRDTKYVGRRVAGRDSEPSHVETALRVSEPALRDASSLGSSGTIAAVASHELETTGSIPVVSVPGKRKAVKHAAPRGPLFQGLPSPPVLLGLASLAVAVTGTVTSAGADLADSMEPRYNAASAVSGDSGIGSVALGDRNPQVSRDSSRDALDDASDTELVEEAEVVAEQRDAALGQLAQLAEKQADKIAENRWVLPISPAVITARFGEYGLWSSYHTGLDFNGDSGDPITSIANGVVTFVGSDGSYGNKTIVTLEDGTELWYCHQSAFNVTEGQTVRAGEIIGAVGSTGHVTGSHLHVEVRPGGGDPVDPYAAFVVHGVTP